MAEWLKAHDSKSCGRDDRLGGSNPLASAKFYANLCFFSFALLQIALHSKKTQICYKISE